MTVCDRCRVKSVRCVMIHTWLGLAFKSGKVCESCAGDLSDWIWIGKPKKFLNHHYSDEPFEGHFYLLAFDSKLFVARRLGGLWRDRVTGEELDQELLHGSPVLARVIY